MQRFAILLVACCVFVPSAYASDAETDRDMCEALRDDPDASGETLDVERLPRGFVCRNMKTCPSAGSLAWIGRTDSGTRFWANTSSDLTRIRNSVSLEQLRGIETDFQKFLKPADPPETVIRVYSADGKRFEERKIQFGSLPRDFVLDVRRSTEKAEDHPAEFSHPKDFAPIEAHAPIEVAPDLQLLNLCR